MSQFAVDRFAYPYDEEEIARITARIVASALGFGKGEIERDQEYICSEYVFECYKRIGIDIPYDERGFVAPADFARNEKVRLLWELEVKRKSHHSLVIHLVIIQKRSPLAQCYHLTL